MGGISGGSGAVVKSRQSGTATFGASIGYSTGLDVTVSTYDTTKALVRCIFPGAKSASDDDVYAEPKNATTITLRRPVNSKATAQTATWEILEFN